MAEIKRPRKTSKVLDVASGTVTVNVKDGDKVLGHVVGDIGKMPAPIMRHLALHGLSQKLGDTYTSETNGDDAGTPEEGLVAMREIYAQLLAGTWTERQEGVGRSRITVEALAAIKFAGDMAKANAAWEKATLEQRKAIRAHPVIQSKVADLQKARATEAMKTAPSLDSLLK